MATELRKASIALLIAVITLALPLSPATIVVSGGCTLADAISSANTDSAVGSCAAGSGADIVRLTSDLMLTAGLPSVTTEISVEGGGFTVARDPVAPEFRFFRVNTGGKLTVSDATLTGGSADAGGAISNDGILTLVNSTLSNNSAGIFGGAIYSGFYGKVNIVDSSLIDNNSFGGLFSYASEITISGSTISGNSFDGVVVFYGSDPVTITNSTISGNGLHGVHTIGGPDYVAVIRAENTTFYNHSRQMYHEFYSLVAIKDNIFADPGGDPCNGEFFIDEGGNVDGNGSCAGGVTLTGFDPSLADNGGPTRTHALLAGSSAIDAASGCGFAVDQRGFGRDADCDSGAFEFEGAPAVAASAGSINARGARCRNVTAGGSVDIPGASRWNCRAAGLAIDGGHRVSQSVRGKPTGPAFTGTVEGISQGRVTCQNFQTGQSVQFMLGAATEFNCRDEGLLFSGDNPIGWTVTGVAD